MSFWHEFGNVFDDPGLGQSILDTEQGLRQQAYNQDIGTAFPGDVFQELDQSIIDSIVGERRGPAQEQVGRQEARGNLNPFGGQTANEFLSGQEPRIQERIGEVGGGVLDEARRGLGEIKDRASGAVNDFTLGDPAFDVTPFAEERQGFIDTETPLIGGSVRDVLSNEPLFDVRGALAEGGKTQGLVSGAPSASFLDTIAARQQAGTRERRGLGSRGSGAF